MNENYQHNIQTGAGQAGRSIGRAAFIGSIEAFKMLARFIGQMLKMVTGK